MKWNLERFELACKMLRLVRFLEQLEHSQIFHPICARLSVCEKLGIQSAAISTQVLQRDRRAHYCYFSSYRFFLEQMYNGNCHLQNEVREAEEHFNKGNKGF